MRLVAWCFLLVWLLGLPVQGSSAAQSLTPSEHNPLYLLFLAPAWQAGAGQTRGEILVGVQTHYTNIFERRRGERYFQDFDGEMLSHDFFLDHRLTRNLAVRLDWGVHRYSGGFLDRSIQSFHDTFGLPNDDRDLVADNRRIMRLQTQCGDLLFDMPAHEWHWDNPQVALAWHGYNGPIGSFSLGSTVKIPLGSGPLHNQHFDISLDLHSSFQGSRWRFDVQAGWLTLQPPDTLKPLTRQSAAYAMLWLERRWFKRLRTFLELDGATAYFRQTGLDTLDHEPVNLTLGLAYQINQRWEMTLTFGEDLTAKGPALDFHLNWGVAVKL